MNKIFVILAVVLVALFLILAGLEISGKTNFFTQTGYDQDFPDQHDLTDDQMISDDSPDFTSLTGVTWVVKDLNGQIVMERPTMTLEFNDDDTVSGSDGCNSYGTTYTFPESESEEGEAVNLLSISPEIVSTLMACLEEGVMEQGASYLEALTKVTSYAIQQDFGVTRLVLYEDGATLITLEAVSNDLFPSDWEVTGYNNGNEAVVSPIQSNIPTISLSPSGEISGFTGCNSYGGDYWSTDAEISISNLAHTEMACLEEGAMEQEAKFLAALENSQTWEVSLDSLSLRSLDGQQMISAVRK